MMNPDRLLPRDFLVDRTDDLRGVRQAAGLFFGVDRFAVEHDLQRSRGTCPHADWDAKLALQKIFETHGLGFEVGSKETAADFDGHSAHPPAGNGSCSRG